MSWTARTPDDVRNVHRRTMPDIYRAWAFVQVFVVPQHDVVIEDLFDNVEDLLAGRTPPRERSRRPLVTRTLLRVT